MKAGVLEDFELHVKIEAGSGLDDLPKYTGTRKAGNTRLRALAEAIILQAIEDLWDDTKREESLHFFKGEGFEICGDMAKLNIAKRFKILEMLSHCGK